MERFSEYSGYADSFEWDGVYVDVTPVNDNNRRHCTVVAIDAIFYRDPRIQFNPKNLRRELNKVCFKLNIGISLQLFFKNYFCI